ncbi:C40 family peptidase [Chryseobacterium sp. POL2]|uniref:C40 family peptidase n=1 Tax=Chryseobacterium sp. POL2 TaxID=2713414 RepID=UPI0013E1EE7F|nr:C40 family peptidase [Chryseobacterium sp. POL2]QIG88360.1 C40 family peptidase [Chryseobacterium sp. POL2]
MKSLVYILIASVTLYSCSTSKTVSRSHSKSKSYKSTSNIKKYASNNSGYKVSKDRNSVVKDAQQYLGVPYKYGGNTKTGLDCSGLVTKVFDENSYKLPRRSSDQAEVGSSIRVEEVMPGDLLFFATAGGRNISHVGIVNNIEKNGEIKFIHASTSKGVIISSLNESYWNKAFLFARSIL